MDELFAHVHEEFDDVLILLDHGIQVSWLEDRLPGDHSFRAVVATIVDEEIPLTVFDIHDWIDWHAVPDLRKRYQ